MNGRPRLSTSKFHSADYLKTPAAIAAYLTEAFETGDTDFIYAALETAARAKGRAIALDDTSKVGFEAVREALNSLGIKLVVEPIAGKKTSV